MHCFFESWQRPTVRRAPSGRSTISRTEFAQQPQPRVTPDEKKRKKERKKGRKRCTVRVADRYEKGVQIDRGSTGEKSRSRII
jgi:hypothetical protein